MYDGRILSTEESLYVSRAQQRIADLGKDLSQGFTDNDVPFTAGELILELQYSINVLNSILLDWTEDEIAVMMDYYTVRAELVTYAFRSLEFNPTPIYPEGNWATVEQVQALREESQAADAALQAQIDTLEDTTVDLQTQIDALNSGSATLTEEITSAQDVGGIQSGDVFPVGTPLTDIWKNLLKVTPKVSSLGLIGTGIAAIIEVGDTVTVSQFTWTVVGVPTNLVLNDSEGLLVNQAVTGSSYTPAVPVTYPFSSNKQVTWTLSGDNIDPITFNINSYYRSYFGKNVAANDTPITITEAMVLAAGVFDVVPTNTSITLPVVTSATEQGFIAVPKSQTGRDYVSWFVDTINSSVIAADNFILPPVVLLVNGINYDIYRWGYRSPLNDNLKLL